MAWIYLILASVCEIGWPVGFKIAQNNDHRVKGIIISLVCMGLSGFLLFLAQRTIPIGTAYAVWTGIGAAGTFMVGVLVFHDVATLMHYFGITLIITGVACLKLAG